MRGRQQHAGIEIYGVNVQSSHPHLDVGVPTPETLVLIQVPAWRHLSREQCRDRIRKMVHEIEWEARKPHRAAGTRPLGATRRHLSTAAAGQRMTPV